MRFLRFFKCRHGAVGRMGRGNVPILKLPMRLVALNYEPARNAASTHVSRGTNESFIPLEFMPEKGAAQGAYRIAIAGDSVETFGFKPRPSSKFGRRPPLFRLSRAAIGGKICA